MSAADPHPAPRLKPQRASASPESARLVRGPHGASIAATGTPLADDDLRRTLETVRTPPRSSLEAPRPKLSNPNRRTSK